MNKPPLKRGIVGRHFLERNKRDIATVPLPIKCCFVTMTYQSFHTAESSYPLKHLVWSSHAKERTERPIPALQFLAARPKLAEDNLRIRVK